MTKLRTSSVKKFNQKESLHIIRLTCKIVLVYWVCLKFFLPNLYDLVVQALPSFCSVMRKNRDKNKQTKTDLRTTTTEILSNVWLLDGEGRSTVRDTPKVVRKSLFLPWYKTRKGNV